MNINSQESLFEKIENDVWFDESGFAGQSIFFIKTNEGKIKAIRQINGSGVPVLYTEIQDVKIQNDSIFLLEGESYMPNEKTEKIIFTYDENEGLKRNGRKLITFFEEPIVYVCSNERNIVDTAIYLKKITNIDFEKQLVYVDDKAYSLNPR